MIDYIQALEVGDMNRITMNVETLKKVLNYYPDNSLVKFIKQKGVVYINIQCKDKKPIM